MMVTMDREVENVSVTLTSFEVVSLYLCTFSGGFQGLPSGHPAMKKARNAVPKHKKGPKFEIKRPEQVLKQRKLNEKKRQKNTKKGGGGGGRGRKKRN